MKIVVVVGLLMLCAMVFCTEDQDGARMGNMTDEQLAMQQLDIEDVDDEEGCIGTAVYAVVADFTWSAASHPTDYPSASAHWSPFAGTTHSPAYRMWGIDLAASPGVQSVAETGATALLGAEIEACGDDCSDMFVFECDKFSGTCVAAGEIEVTVERPRFSAVSMVAPSPDWFVGIHDLELCKFGTWVPFFTTDLLAHDSGTDSGITYTSPNEATTPPTNIFFISDEDHVLFNPTEMDILPMGNFTITLTEVL